MLALPSCRVRVQSAMISHPIHPTPVSFGERLAASATFDLLFRDGMALVEETAAYLDGAGREESRGLPRLAALAYASESMRLTTRLMQIASWLLLQRAVNEGEMSQGDAANDKNRSRTAWHAQMAKHADKPVADGLPASLVDLIGKSLHLQERVQRLDAALSETAGHGGGTDGPRPLERQRALLRDAFPG